MDFTVDNSRTTVKICNALVKAIEKEIDKQALAYPMTDRLRFKAFAHWFIGKTYEDGIYPRQEHEIGTNNTGE